jgi:cbb3-type cytochrome oxidase subunit 3
MTFGYPRWLDADWTITIFMFLLIGTYWALPKSTRCLASCS